MAAKLSRSARRDLEEIRKYALARWGRDQWLRYYTGLVAAFDRVGKDARCGRPRDTLHKGLRSLAYQQHAIFFYPSRHTAGAVVIVRVVHQSRNFAALAFTDDVEGESSA
jgi:toxin ParE1/3/4